MDVFFLSSTSYLLGNSLSSYMYLDSLDLRRMHGYLYQAEAPIPFLVAICRELPQS